MYKIVIIEDSGKKVDVMEFDNRPNAFGTFLKLVNDEYELIDRLKKFIIREHEVIIRGDLFFSKEDIKHNKYILLIGDDLTEYKKIGKYKQLLKRYSKLF